MPFTNSQELGRPVAILDEGLTLTPSVSSMNFTGSGVTGTALGSSVTETIPGGGGGFTKLTATGSVNGINKVFTFSQQPSYIVSDGVWSLATDSNGGVQWTWNAGTSQVTMVVPPQASIYGVA